MFFNVNGTVRVKLTDFGREALRQSHDDLYRGWKKKPKYAPPAEDAEGWSEWQAWSLMSELGRYMSLGFKPPFETEIEIVEDPDFTRPSAQALPALHTA